MHRREQGVRHVGAVEPPLTAHPQPGPRPRALRRRTGVVGREGGGQARPPRGEGVVQRGGEVLERRDGELRGGAAAELRADPVDLRGREAQPVLRAEDRLRRDRGREARPVQERSDPRGQLGEGEDLDGGGPRVPGAVQDHAIRAERHAQPLGARGVGEGEHEQHPGGQEVLEHRVLRGAVTGRRRRGRRRPLGVLEERAVDGMQPLGRHAPGPHPRGRLRHAHLQLTHRSPPRSRPGPSRCLSRADATVTPPRVPWGLLPVWTHRHWGGTTTGVRLVTRDGGRGPPAAARS